MRVLVTRPEPGASRTARRLEALGYEPIVLPLSETRPVAVDLAMLPESPAAVALTSANAVRHAPRDVLRRLAALPCSVVGAATAEAAQTAGFTDIREGPGDADGLARILIAERLSGLVVYLCGRLRRPDFETTLVDSGIKIHAIETYDTVALEPEHLPAAIGPGDAALLYSAVAAEAFAVLAARQEGVGLRRLPLLCLSERIARPLRPRFDDNIAVAAKPDEASLLSLLG